MIPEILFELCSGQKCGLRTDRRTDRPTSAKQYTPAFSKGGIIILTNKVRNKETNEYTRGRNIRSKQDLNQGCLDEKPVP